MTTLTLVTDYTTASPMGTVLEAWAASIATLSAGAHSVTVYNPGELVPAFESFDAVSTAQVDMAFLSPVYYSSKLPGMEILGTAFRAEAGTESALALTRALATGAPDADLELFGMSALAAAFDAPRGLYTSFAASTPDDLDGRKLFMTGSIASTLASEAGAAVINLPAAELYTALQTGVIDGAMLNAHEAEKLDIDNLMRHHLLLPDNTGLQNLYRALVINDGSFDALPQDLRTLLEQTTGATLAADLGAAALDSHQRGIIISTRFGRLEYPEGADLDAWRMLTDTEVAQIIANSTDGDTSRGEAWLNAFVTASGGETPQEPVIENLTLTGTSGDDTLSGGDGDDTINGLDGSDNLIGGGGDDVINGGATDQDRRDNIFGGAGNDTIDGGYGNDMLRGDAGDDVIAGGFGGDTVIGGTGNDSLTGSALGDMLFGSDGDDFINGGFGYDQINGGAGADMFFHLGIADHGSDWVQDYSAADGDTLVFGDRNATANQFQINYASKDNAGDDSVEEAFVIYRPTGQIMWALIDGAGQDSINLQIGSDTFDLML
ncbi:TRAP transporter substrate-binding protein DctP [Sulfitobacter sp. F26169L]|uniref:TRAP transporter substrate-binding protein DctP n=1 Tax=Sulfitobacter sp. F26169L TaxID=2996015 RepID=UPI00226096F3|nr:TRAP transporter substrate-binding protein DctP [Sulfitobacter sp. F26169L]MCX7568016.1 TRAP transporter substrate-binding protein DctP [Sulfitobacter sp. F26169L]